MSPPAGLLATIELSSVAEPALYRPPPLAAELPEAVLSIICTEASLQMSPPWLPEEFAAIVLSMIVRDPKRFSIAPPKPPAESWASVQPMRVTRPSLKIAPPPLVAVSAVRLQSVRLSSPKLAMPPP